MQQTPDGYVIVNWTAAPLVELPFSGNTGFWLLAAAGLVLCLIVLRPHIVEYARVSRLKRAAKKEADE